MDYTLTVTLSDNGSGQEQQATSFTTQVSVHGFGRIDTRGLLLAQYDKMSVAVVNKHVAGDESG